MLIVASFVPRPVLGDETVEDQQNVIEEMVDERVDCNEDEMVDERLDCNEDEELEQVSAAESGSSYTVHPSGRLTLVFKNSPQHYSSPAHSPAMAVVDSKPVDTIRDVRVKLERCDDSDASDVTPAKRCRLEDDGRTCVTSSPQVDPVERVTSERNADMALSEADAAVAGLLGCSSVSDDCVSDVLKEVAATHFGPLRDDLDLYSTDSCSVPNDVFSDAKVNLERGAKHLTENGISSPLEDGLAINGNRGIIAQSDTSDGEISTAVNNLMADLSQLNAITSDTVRTVIPNGSVYLPATATKISLVKRTVDTSVAVTRSLDSTSLSGSVAPPVNNIQQSLHVDNMTHSLRPFPYCNQAMFGSVSDHESDLDAAIKSILS